MEDSQATLCDLKKIAEKFVSERDWNQYHNPKNLSMNITREASELMEKFLWLTAQESRDALVTNRQEIEDELADVFFGVMCFANTANIDLTRAFIHKIKDAAKKYPVDKAKGCNKKYTKL